MEKSEEGRKRGKGKERIDEGNKLEIHGKSDTQSDSSVQSSTVILP